MLGVHGHHRRIADPTKFEWLAGMQEYQVLATVGVIGLLLSQIPFVWNFFYSIFRGVEAERNPWRATTLEWAAPSPPPHGNFEEAPAVYREPYAYSLPGATEDFVPQFQAPQDLTSASA